MTNRTSSVRVNNYLSDRFLVTSGVPQGSVLGPILSVIYVNDMFVIVKNEPVELYLYADDAKLYKIITSKDDRALLQTCLNALNVWCDDWGVRMNVDKCVAMRFGHRIDVDDNEDWVYNIGEEGLNYCDQIKDLGVVFNDSLNFSVHIYETINKCISILALIQRNFKDLTKESFLLMYKSLVRSKLEYAGNVWSPWKIKEIESIERVQKRATKMVKECVGLKYEERLKALNLPCLRYRRTRGDLIVVFNVLRNHED